MKDARRSAGLGALIILLTVVVYIPALRGGFVFDDNLLITENRIVRASDGLHRFWVTTEAPDYYPLTWSLWWVEWRLWGNRAAGYHVVNVLLHAACALLIWIVLRQLKIPGAWLAALVFAVHPVNVATAAWISEQKNTLSMLLFLLSILLYLKFDETGRWRWYSLSLVAFLLALLSKSAVVMLPVVLLGCVWWLRGRVQWKDVLRSVPFFVASLAMGLATIWFQHYRALGGQTVRMEGFMARLASVGWVPWFYVGKALVPINLMVIYPKWEIRPSLWTSYIPGMIMVGILALLWWQRKTWGRPLLFGIGYFVVMLFPVLGFFDQGFYRGSFVADHWQYYSIVAVITLVVVAGERICRRWDEWGRASGMLVGVITLTVLGVATWKRSGLYADNETLWRDNLAKNPKAWPAYNNLGCALQRADKSIDSVWFFEQALRLNPDYPDAHNNLGVALAKLGRLQEAFEHFGQALRLKPNYAEVHYNLAIALQQTGKIEDVIGHLKQSLRLDPDYAQAHYGLGIALVRQGKMPEAMAQWEQTLRLNPDHAEAHYNLGIALGQAGRLEDAIRHFERALQIKPAMPEANYDLGIARMRQGKMPEAMAQWERALQLKPDYAEAHYNLGIALGQAGRLEDEIRHLEQAAQSKPDLVEAHYDLAMALASQGKMPEAMAQWEQTLRLKPDHVAAHNDLANALLQFGRTQEAVGHYEQALRLKPEFAPAHNNLGIALTRLGQLPEAIAHFEQALQISPDYLDAHYNLGVDLERVGRTKEAVAHYEQALRINPDYADAQKRLDRLDAVR